MKFFKSSTLLFAVIAVFFFLTLAQFGFFNGVKFSRGIDNAAIFIRGAFPPDWRALEGIGALLFETVQMAFAGTLLGFLISLPLAVLTARNLSPLWLSALARLIAAVLRTVPPLVWGILFVIVTGLGPLAGTLSVALYTVGYLAKLYAELFEGTDPEILEALGARKISSPFLLRFAVLPENANAVLSQLLFMFEYNIRASSILGFVGAGGIGFQIHVYLQTLEYQKLTAVLVPILAIVLLMDCLGTFLRRRCMPGAVGR